MLKSVLHFILKKIYRIEITGLENYSAAGKRVLIVANHLSFLDALLLAVFLPEKPLFAINTFIAKAWWLRPFLTLVNSFPLDPTNPMATKALISEIRKDKKCIIFPEGRITVTGSLMKVYEGPGMIADRANATILPIRIDGAQYTPFSRLKGKVCIRWFPKITIRIQEPRKLDINKNIVGRARRNAMGLKLYDIMSNMLFETSDYKKTLFQSLLDASKINGKSHKIVVDVKREPLSYVALISKSFVIGEQIAKNTKEGDYIGILLSNMGSSIVVFFGMQAFGRVPAMLNFSAGLNNILSACNTAGISKVYTSRQFIEMASLQDIVSGLEQALIEVIYLEDVVKSISAFNKIRGFIAGYLFPQLYYNLISKANAEDGAVVIFTSGSEGTPKGVVLSHINIQANRYQISARVDFGPTDKVFNALPIFHSFGLTAATLLPILSGIQVFFYPSPLHYRIVPELIYDTNSTIVFGTDTFLTGYARFANPYDFYAVRYVFAGAERLRDETRRLYSEKYGVRVLEGYGATETSPVISINTAMHNKTRTVGRLLPAIKYKLEEVSGIENGGRLLVSGPNVMKGYLLSDSPKTLVKPTDGWYDTGDIVTFDDDGYIAIKGRAKRFAKIAGEMVSLTAAEGLISAVYPNYAHAVITIPDKKKGEALLLITENKNANVSDIIAYAKSKSFAELMIPKKIEYIEQLPVLGTGKIDYVALNNIYVTEKKRVA